MEDLDDYKSIVFNNRKSTDFGVLVKYPFNPVHPTPDITTTHVNSRSGDYLVDYGSYQNTTQTFNIIVKKPSEWTRAEFNRQLINWLMPPHFDGKRQYSYFYFDEDENYAFYGIVKDAPIIEWDENATDFGTGTISIYTDPFYYRLDGIKFTDLPQAGYIKNLDSRETSPDWHFIANGSFILYVNSLPYEFDNMEGEFWVSGETGDVYDVKNNLYNNQCHFPNLEPPTLLYGKNTIEITADSSSTIQLAEYKPKWRRLI